MTFRYLIFGLIFAYLLQVKHTKNYYVKHFFQNQKRHRIIQIDRL